LEKVIDLLGGGKCLQMGVSVCERVLWPLAVSYQQPYDDSANLNKQVTMDDRKISDKPFGYPSQKQKRSNATHKPTQVASHLLLPNAPENQLQSLHLTNTFYD
jgi:hypothetical protein